jgi:hypothetical protein
MATSPDVALLELLRVEAESLRDCYEEGAQGFASTARRSPALCVLKIRRQ